MIYEKDVVKYEKDIVKMAKEGVMTHEEKLKDMSRMADEMQAVLNDIIIKVAEQNRFWKELLEKTTRGQK